MKIAFKNIFTANHIHYTHCAGTQDIIKKVFPCGPCGRKIGFKRCVFIDTAQYISDTIQYVFDRDSTDEKSSPDFI